MLSKCKVWTKSVMKLPSAKNQIKLQFLIKWFKNFKRRHSTFVVASIDPSQQTMKELHSLKDKVYTKIENHDDMFNLAERGELSKLKEVLLKGSSVDTRNAKNKYKSLMHIAARKCNFDLLSLLTDFKADVNNEDEIGATPIFEAIEAKDARMVAELISLGANVCHKDSQDSTPIYWGVYCSTIEILDILKANGAKLHNANIINRTPLIKSAFIGKHEIVEWLLRDEELLTMIDYQDERGRTALHAACWGSRGGRQGKYIAGVLLDDSPESMIALLNKGANVSR